MKRKAGLNYQEPTIESKVFIECPFEMVSHKILSDNRRNEKILQQKEESQEPNSDDDEETGDLAPSVVVLKKGDLGEQEFKKLKEEEKAKKDAGT